MFGTKKRKFAEIQLEILRSLKKKQCTIYQIAKKNHTDFRTVRHQLILLKGQDYVSLIFELNHIKVFSITKKGEKYIKKLQR
jgi:predicted transcriptional regulator